MNAEIQRAVEVEIGSRIVRSSALAGGCISEAFRCSTADGRELFVKCHREAPPEFFSLEAAGLAWLAEPSALTTPEVLGHGQEFLALEYLPPGPQAPDFAAQFGRGLALLHKFGAKSFGWRQDNFLATLPQNNTNHAHWPTFYSESRLRPLLRLCIDRGLAPPSWLARFEVLFSQMLELTGNQELPSRCHGDLWSGNVHCGPTGKPVLIDPAVYGGHREIDLAMLELFGSPGDDFYRAYDEAYPRSQGHKERVSLYQLYPLLAHIALFGSSYVQQCEQALARWC